MTHTKLWAVLAGSAVAISALTMVGFGAAMAQRGGGPPPPPPPRGGGPPPPPPPRDGGPGWQCSGPSHHWQNRMDQRGWHDRMNDHWRDRIGDRGRQNRMDDHWQNRMGDRWQGPGKDDPFGARGEVGPGSFDAMASGRHGQMFGRMHSDGLLTVLMGSRTDQGKMGAHGRHHRVQSPQQRWMMGRIGRIMVLRSQLNLTADQRSKIRDIVKGSRQGLRQTLQPVVGKRLALRELVLSGNADEKAIRQAADQLGKAAGDAAVQFSQTMTKVRKVLTAPQAQAVDEFLKGNLQAEKQLMSRMLEKQSKAADKSASKPEKK